MSGLVSTGAALDYAPRLSRRSSLYAKTAEAPYAEIVGGVCSHLNAGYVHAAKADRLCAVCDPGRFYALSSANSRPTDRIQSAVNLRASVEWLLTP